MHELVQEQTRNKNRVNQGLQRQLNGQGEHAAVQQRKRYMQQNRERRQVHAHDGMANRGGGYMGAGRGAGGGFAGGGRGAGGGGRR